METISQEEFKKRYGEGAINKFSNVPTPKKSGLTDAFEDLAQTFTSLKDTAVSSARGVGSAVQKSATGQRNPVLAGFDVAGNVVGGISKGIGDVALGAGKLALSQEDEDKVANAVKSAITPIVSTPEVQSLISKYNSLDENSKQNLRTTGNIGMALVDILTLGAAGRGVGVAKQVGEKGIDLASQTLKEAGIKVGEGVGGVVKPITRELSAIPKRIGANIEAGKITEQTIKSLPKEAQQAVNLGVEIPDAQYLTKLPSTQKAPLKKLYEATKSFVDGTSKTNPIEIVGKPVVKRLQQLKSQSDGFVKKLDQVANSLKGKTVNEYDSIVSKIDSDLDNLNIGRTDTGLDFANADLVGGEKEIAQIYKRILNAKDANDLHRVKRFIDSNVEFGKTQSGLTGAAENTLKGWRKLIDTALDTQFKPYNKVNTELAKRMKPIEDLQAVLKGQGLDEDLLNMKAGMLMRRITSNAQSNPAIRQILRDLDKATAIKGKTSLNVENLVDFYSTLEKYFPEIVGKNTLKGQITGGIENVQGVQEIIVGGLKKLAGQTPEAQRKGIIQLLDSVLK